MSVPMAVQRTILVVDDDRRNRGLLQRFCHELGHAVIEAQNGVEAVAAAKEHRPDIILMDIMMPEMDGFTATGILKNDEHLRYIPVIVLTSMSAPQDRLRAISQGADDYLLKPIDMEELALRINNHLRIKEYHDMVVSYNATLESEVQKKTAEIRAALQQVDSMYSKVKSGYIDTIHRLARAAEFKDNHTGHHIKRMGLYAVLLSEELGLDKDFREIMFYAAPMHDVGKVGIPDHVLLKPGALNDEERSIMRRHSTIGAHILKGSDSPFLIMAERIALSHHERWAGGGYPDGIAGESIPLEARIVNIVDQYDALRSKRVYKPALSHEQVCQIITEGDGNTKPEHFDPAVLAAFQRTHGKFDAIFQTMKDDSD